MNNALRVNAALTSGGVHTPSDANQVFTSIFDPTNNAIRVNCVLGCGGSGGGFAPAGDLAGSSTSQTVIGLQGRTLSATAPTPNQVLSWNGTAWVPTSLAAGAGTGACTGNQWVTSVNLGANPTCSQPSFANLSGTAASTQLPSASASALGVIQLSGDLGGTPSSPQIISLQGTALSVTGTPAANQVLTWTGTAWSPANAPATGAQIAQDLGGTTSAPKVVGLQGNAISSTAPTTGNQFLGWNSGSNQWAPTQPSFTNLSGVVSSSQLPAATAGAQGAIQLAGDLSGTSSAPTVAKLRGSTISSTAPTSSNQFLGWNTATSQWTPTQPSFTNLSGTATDAQLGSAYSGIGSCPANQFAITLSRNALPTCAQPSFSSLSGAATPAQLPGATASAQGAIQLAGDLGGTSGAPTVAKLQNTAVSITGTPAANQVLTWTGTAWSAATLPATGAQIAQDLGGTTASPKVVGIQGNAVSATAPTSSNQFLGWNSGASQWTPTQPSFTNLGGTATDAQLGSAYSGVGACGANQFASALTRNSPPSCSAAVTASNAPANQFAVGISTAGALSYAQPTFANLGGAATKAQQAPTTAYTDQANTFAAGSKQTFTGSATTAGINLAPLTGDPTTPASGDLWTTGTQLRWRDAGGTPTTRTAVDTTRAVNVVAPISGGGTLSADLTLSCPTCVTGVGASGPLTSTGGVAPSIGLANQNSNTVLAGPSSGGSGAPTFRALTGSDLPAPQAAALGGVKTIDCTGTGHLLKLDSTGTFTCSPDSGGSGGSPGGSSGAVQGNTSGAFGAIPGFTFDTSSGALTAQPTSGLAVAATFKAAAGGTADVADFFNASGAKSVWVDASGNLNFTGNNVTYGTPSQGTQSYLRLYGSTASGNLAPPYLDLEKTDGTAKTYLAPSTGLGGAIWVSSTVPGGDVAQPGNVFSIDGPEMVVANAATTGTVASSLAKLTGAPSTAVLIGTSDTAVPAFIVTAGAGTSGNAFLASSGSVASCVFDGATTAGDYVQASTTTAGDCHDAGAVPPSSGWVIGQVLSTNASTGTYNVAVTGYQAASSGGGGATFQVNGVNTASQSTVNFQSGTNIAVTNPSAGNVAFNLTGAVPVANGGTGQTTAAAAFNALAPATAQGGLILANGVNSYGNLAIGANGQCLTSNGTTALWGSCAGGGSVSSVFGRTGAVVAASGDYTLDQIGNPAGAVNWTLNSGDNITITNNAAAQVPLTVTAASGQSSDILDVKTSSGSTVFSINSGGSTMIGTSLQITSGSGQISGQGNSQAVLLQSGKDSSTGASQGALTLRGGAVSGGTSTNSAGSVLLQGGDDSAGNTASSAGSLLLRSGLATGATQGVQGLNSFVESFVKGTTVTQWNLQCITAAMTVQDCGASPGNVIGVAAIVGSNTVEVITQGETLVNASAAVTVGHPVCAGTTAGQVTDSGSTSACANGSGIGVVAATSGSFKLGDGTALSPSTTLPLITIRFD